MPTNNKRTIFTSNQAIYGIRPLEDGKFYIMYRDNAKVNKKFYKKASGQAFKSPQIAQYALNKMIDDITKTHGTKFKAKEVGLWSAMEEYITDED